jgi:hypothetical protein
MNEHDLFKYNGNSSKIVMRRKIMNRTFVVHEIDRGKMYGTIEFMKDDMFKKAKMVRHKILESKVEALVLCAKWYKWTRIQVIFGLSMMAAAVSLPIIGAIFSYD